jgi:hypothetical protein
MPTVSRTARLLDLAAIACIIVGVLLFLSGSARLTELAKLSYRHPGPRSESALEAADRARWLAHGGLALVVAGGVVGVVGAVQHSRINRQKPAA